MDISNLIGGIIGGALSSSVISAIAAFLAKTAKERWIEGVKAQYDKELEQVRDSLQRDQKNLQAKLDHTTYVTEAQYDLELSSYKELWLAMSDLRERLKAVFVVHGVEAQIKAQFGDDEFAARVKQADKNLSDAFDNAILVSERLAPFYAKSIQAEARATTLLIQQFSFSVNNGTKPPSGEEILRDLNSIILKVEKIDDLIRDRLSSLRLSQ